MALAMDAGRGQGLSRAGRRVREKSAAGQKGIAPRRILCYAAQLAYASDWPDYRASRTGCVACGAAESKIT